ncbi:hypothetical protein NVV78_06545 [Pediococcus ethanolidurans]|uniref:hypothetical protein n=1 Tax=Pediococcus ethanolidurans TaxID=319653 RepID=UPI0021E7AB03|nr:hypothetical protein [Pediococcus ethanolidurans]MCV3315600.1 hypothetical protein [Pediococcus ethanolidurans]
MSEALATKNQNENAGISLIVNADMKQMTEQLKSIANFQSMVQTNLVKKQDYGVIPGTGKPTLLKPGAEKILMLMGVASEYEIIEKIEDYEKGFFAYTIRCTLLKNDVKITEGLGSCNTKEKRYRNQDVFMIVNTVLKMAKKRAQVDATLTIASLSNVFTQDIEDMDNFNEKETMDNLNINDAREMKVTFGKKHKGDTLGDIVVSDRSYVEWLVKNAMAPEMKKAAGMVLNPPKVNIDPNKPVLASKSQLELINKGIDEITMETDTAVEDVMDKFLKLGHTSSFAKMTTQNASIIIKAIDRQKEKIQKEKDIAKTTKDIFKGSTEQEISDDDLPF